ncbi:uncharacterized protein CANTADRAFT_46523 [Suhomyces tanzawaensis NRRL Y-17324]|uniref:C2H2-type domain-containing protein n=1 Tax=Suhomyces tanzawaensis NRRL Y-17324 TaxID=984487 RepID=A0A1E4SP76_9ASCO|nr:uncharacterized protein CANTADRAFT_46523 [Suhomyces tanzawaensis NRRL Y-17324]ODV81217.1 hypothetical protein CANTADRAFT_46523 [Suhomyces tanzawaensis NRRL Y-17324]
MENSESESYHPFQNSHNGSIDYSSLVSYTISPSLKRKRRKAKSLSEVGGLDPSLGKGGSFSCQVCHKVFQKQYNLKSHMKIHFSEKPYQCSKCPKRFARSHDKKRHELLHEGVKNFKCEGYLKDGVTKWGCGKKFARSDALSRHFRTETGWLCIRPLMEESKHLEAKDGSLIQHSHLLQPSQPQSDINQANGSTVEGDKIVNGDGSYIYNSSLIRRLIQSK